ncbi:MAG: hypothetical protein HWN65_22525 [Candidatus Helarchaeota archaeon]|nr:hypothetical protein [Candidatus Helarchaeota archaeon]
MTHIHEARFQKNAEALRRQWNLELDETLEEIEIIIKEEFYTGIWGLLFNRIIAGIYSLFFSKDIKKKIKKQFEVILNASRDFNGNPEEIIENYFDEYLKNDVGFARIKKRHKKTPELLERIKQSLIIMVRGTNDLLKCEGECYDDLLLDAYQTKEEAERSVYALIDDAGDNLEFTVDNKMVKINKLIRSHVIKILRKEVEIARDYYTKKLNELYGN